jgi:acetyl-CoA C-acetyltransferase
MELTDVVAVSAVRTPMGKFGGSFKDMAAYDLGAVAIRGARKRVDLGPFDADEVLFGSCRQAGNGPNPARTASVRGGVDTAIPVQTINMACPSGMMCVIAASRAIRLGDSRIVITGGMDSMSTIPYLLKKCRWSGFKMGNRVLEDGWSDSIDPLCGVGMGQTAENLYEKYKISRGAQDEFAVESHKKAARAREEGWFDREIVPVLLPPHPKTGEQITVEKDETIRADTSVEKLARLRPVFKKDGVVTAGNACSMSDGATALVITSREVARERGWTPLFSILGYSSVAVAPETMGEGPGISIPKALEHANLTLDDMDAYEVNEAFAIQVLANEQMLGWDRTRLNQHGGAIALGHPTGISGARILVTLDGVLRRLGKDLGIAAICGGGGVSTAMVIRRES